jgi:hypothetical protein
MGLDMYLYEKQVHEVAYWRKANAIHGWIINYTNSIDDCTPIHLNKRDLIVLRDTCIQVLEQAQWKRLWICCHLQQDSSLVLLK